MKQLSGLRKADVAHGDDCTLTRFVKIEGRAKQKLPTHIAGGIPAFVQQARTKFPSRVLKLSQMTNLLVSGHSNVKIGRDVRKGKLKGYWIYTLSLEERKTCPSTCKHWQNCYGNNMPFAKRIDHTDPAFLPVLKSEIAQLCRKHYGVLIRLHALGDFYSVEYVTFWNDMLREHKNLSVFGYTGHDKLSAIGSCIHGINLAWGPRSMIRYSNGLGETMSTVSIAGTAQPPAGSFACPEQDNKVACCATCGLCWGTTKNVAFKEH